MTALTDVTDDDAQGVQERPGDPNLLAGDAGVNQAGYVLGPSGPDRPQGGERDVTLGNDARVTSPPGVIANSRNRLVARPAILCGVPEVGLGEA